MLNTHVWASVAIFLVLWLAWGMVHSHRNGVLHAIYKQHLRDSNKERLFLASLSFFVTFAGVRALTHAIHAGRGPFHDVSMHGRHIHHLVWGILILLVVGYLWLLQVGTGETLRSVWLARMLSLLYGVGAALTLDEFALWLNLRDVYWEREGRASLDAAFLFGGLLSVGVWGGRFMHAIARELVRRPR
jgi:hypothetical protein